MKFINHADVERPAALVFAHVSDFAALEQRARNAGIEVERVAGSGRAEIGSEWQVSGRFAGAERETQVRLAEVVEPSLLAFHNSASGFEIEFNVQVMPLAPNRTRLRTVIDIRARSLASRVMLQSARLIRPRINSRIDKALSNVAKRIEKES